MNNDLISRKAFRKKLIDHQMNYAFYDLHLRHEIGCIIDMLDNEPPVEVEPLRHGKWIEDHMDWKCSCCNTVFHDDLEWILAYDEHAMPKYCPECGAKMDGGKNDDAH